MNNIWEDKSGFRQFHQLSHKNGYAYVYMAEGEPGWQCAIRKTGEEDVYPTLKRDEDGKFWSDTSLTFDELKRVCEKTLENKK